MSYDSIRMYGEKHGYSQRDKMVHSRATNKNVSMLEGIVQRTSNEKSRRSLKGKIRELKEERDYVLSKW